MAPCVSDAAALDASVDIRDPQPTVVQALVGQGLFQGEVRAMRLLGRHEDRDLGQREGPTVQVLQQPAPRGKGNGVASARGLSWAQGGRPARPRGQEPWVLPPRQAT